MLPQGDYVFTVIQVLFVYSTTALRPPDKRSLQWYNATPYTAYTGHSCSRGSVLKNSLLSAEVRVRKLTSGRVMVLNLATLTGIFINLYIF